MKLPLSIGILRSLIMAAALVASATRQQASAATIINLPFNEGNGLSTANLGTSGGTGLFAQQGNLPIFTANVPAGPNAPGANVSSIDFGNITAGAGGRAIDFPLTTAAPTIGLAAFTITGWVNIRSGTVGPGGNRIFSTWSGEFGPDDGIDLVQESGGRLRFGINEAGDFPGPGPFSSFDKLTVDSGGGVDNWVFFAATYDAKDLGDLTDGEVSYYFGNGNTPAAFDLLELYDRGVVQPPAGDESGALTVGNFTVDVVARDATGGGSRVLRGLVDELQLFDRVLTESEIRGAQVPEPNTGLLLVGSLLTLASRSRRRLGAD